MSRLASPQAPRRWWKLIAPHLRLAGGLLMPNKHSSRCLYRDVALLKQIFRFAAPPRPIKSESHGCAPNSFLKVPLGILIIRISRGTLRSFPDRSVGKESACNAGDPGSIPGSGRYPGGGNDNPLQYSCLGNSMDRGTRPGTVHGVTKSDMTY